jgi:hypothetical protein
MHNNPMNGTPPVLDQIADMVLSYRPKDKQKKARPRKKKKAKRGKS